MLFLCPIMEIIAHRGASHDAPENTLAAFRLGWQQRADAIELDIHLTKDGQVVVIHDATTKRTIGIDNPVATQTLTELRAFNAGSWKDAQWAEERIPTLTEALLTIPDGKRMFIEIKCGPDVLPALDRVMKTCGKSPSQLVIIGFDYSTMRQAKQHFPNLPVFWLAGYKADSKTGRFPVIEELIDKAKAAKLDGLDLEFKFPIDTTFVSEVKAAGLRLFVWTVDDVVIARNLIEAGVDGITTNRPLWLHKQLK